MAVTWWWPFPTLRSPDPSDATDLLVKLMLAQASNAQGDADPARAGVVETARGLYGRALASARVVGARPAVASALTPRALSRMGRDFIEHGQTSALLEFEQTRMTLRHVVVRERTRGRYRIAYPSADDMQLVERTVAPSRLLHVVYQGGTFVGTPPWASAAHAAQALANFERSVAHEAGGPVGRALPAVRAPNQPQNEELADTYEVTILPRLRQAMGNIVQLGAQSARGFRGGELNGSNAKDGETMRFGPEFANPYAELLQELRAELAGALGVPAPLVSSDAAASGQREAMRAFIESSVVPVADILAEQLREQLDTPELRLTFPRLRSGDAMARARAVQSFTNAGVELSDALEYAGLTD